MNAPVVDDNDKQSKSLARRFIMRYQASTEAVIIKPPPSPRYTSALLGYMRKKAMTTAACLRDVGLQTYQQSARLAQPEIHQTLVLQS
jgi:hypothetical protein